METYIETLDRGFKHVNGVFKYFDENRDSDPNLFELVTILCGATRDPKKMDGEHKDIITRLTMLTLDRLKRNGIVKNDDDILVQMICNIYDKFINGEEISEKMQRYLEKLAGISFFLRQMDKNNGQLTYYGNEYEYRELLAYKSAAFKEVDALDDIYLRVEALIASRCIPELIHTKEGFEALTGSYDSLEPLPKKYTLVEEEVIDERTNEKTVRVVGIKPANLEAHKTL